MSFLNIFSKPEVEGQKSTPFSLLTAAVTEWRGKDVKQLDRTEIERLVENLEEQVVKIKNLDVSSVEGAQVSKDNWMNVGKEMSEAKGYLEATEREFVIIKKDSWGITKFLQRFWARWTNQGKFIEVDYKIKSTEVTLPEKITKMFQEKVPAGGGQRPLQKPMSRQQGASLAGQVTQQVLQTPVVEAAITARLDDLEKKINNFTFIGEANFRNAAAGLGDAARSAYTAVDLDKQKKTFKLLYIQDSGKVAEETIQIVEGGKLQAKSKGYADLDALIKGLGVQVPVDPQELKLRVEARSKVIKTLEDRAAADAKLHDRVVNAFPEAHCWSVKKTEEQQSGWSLGGVVSGVGSAVWGVKDLTRQALGKVQKVFGYKEQELTIEPCNYYINQEKGARIQLELKFEKGSWNITGGNKEQSAATIEGFVETQHLDKGLQLSALSARLKDIQKVLGDKTTSATLDQELITAAKGAAKSIACVEYDGKAYYMCVIQPNGQTVEKKKIELLPKDNNLFKIDGCGYSDLKIYFNKMHAVPLDERQGEMKKQEEVFLSSMNVFSIKSSVDNLKEMKERLKLWADILNPGEFAFPNFQWENDRILCILAPNKDPRMYKVNFVGGQPQYYLYERGAFKANPENLDLTLNDLKKGVSIQELDRRYKESEAVKSKAGPREDERRAGAPGKGRVSSPRATGAVRLSAASSIPERPSWLDELYQLGSAPDNFATLATSFESTYLKKGWPHSLVRGLGIKNPEKATSASKPNRENFASNKTTILEKIKGLPVIEQFWLYELAFGTTVFSNKENEPKNQAKKTLEEILRSSLSEDDNRYRLMQYWERNAASYLTGANTLRDKVFRSYWPSS